MKTALSILVAQMLVGCHNEAVASPARNPESSGELSVVSESGARYAGSVVRINVRFTEPTAPEVEIDITSRNKNNQDWTLYARLASAFLATGKMALPLRAGAIEAGSGTVQLRHGAQSPVLAEQGTVELVATGKQIRGTVQGAGAELDAQFSGPLAIVCAVRREAMPSGGATPVADSPGGTSAPVLVVDQRMESDLCRPLLAGIGREPAQSEASKP